MRLKERTIVFFLVICLSSQCMAVYSRTKGEADRCSVNLVESIPEGVSYKSGSPAHVSTYFAWKTLVDLAENNVTIASFYWSMLPEDVVNVSSAYMGEDVFNLLSARSSKVDVTIVTNGVRAPDNDLDKLVAKGAHVYWLDVSRLLHQGVQHAKLWTVDASHAYLGSANMDWRSLSQVKELGLIFYSCPSLASDLEKIIHSFIFLSGPNSTVPVDDWPVELTTKYNRTSPMNVMLNGIQSEAYFTMSPPLFTPPGRSDDLDAILHIIVEAQFFVFISVMDYAPMIKNYSPFLDDIYWPDINNALMEAAFKRKVEIRLLVSKWRHTSRNLNGFMKSLRELNDIERSRIRIRYFVVPTLTEEQRSIPFGRVNHNKYMVTDKTLYIGTSNWSGDYFKYTGGAAFVAYEGNQTGPNGNPTLRSQLFDLFYRDWNSEYSYEL